MIALSGRLIAVLLLFSPVVFAQVFETPEQAAADPDFSVQGEYAKDGAGIQVVALGDGEFEIVLYRGGLPGAGWDGQQPQRTEGDADDVADICEGYRKTLRESPTLNAKPPADAVVLFDGRAESLNKHWKKGARRTDDGLMKEGATSIDKFQDFRLHLEFRTPFMPKARGQKRGNSGLYYQGRYETQILDSFGLKGENNETGGIYSIRKPDLNMCFPPLSWQTYDAVFTAARYQAGKKVSNARLTVRLNGVVVHNNVELPKKTTAAPVKESADTGPVYLQNHGNPVRFKNIWVLPIDSAKEARRPIVPSFERMYADGSHAEVGGKLLAAELNCVACHQGPSQSTAKLAPVLTKAGERLQADYVYRFLQNPHEVKPGTTMPVVLNAVPEADRESAAAALTSYLLADGKLPSEKLNRKWVRNGSRLYHEVGCVACHARMDSDSPSAATSVPLVALGEKYSRASLQKFLADPHAVRQSGRMPGIDLSKNELRDLAHFLTADSSDQPSTPNATYKLYHASLEDVLKLDDFSPVSEGVCSGLDIGVADRRDGFCIRFEGAIRIEKSGTYQFDLGSDDGSVLFVNNERLIVNNGVHPHTFKSESVELEAGVHQIRVDYSEVGGEESLDLYVEGPGLSRTTIDALLSFDADRKSQKPITSSGEESFVIQPSLAEQGRELFVKLNCVQCHAKDGVQAPASQAPGFADCASDQGCLAATPKPSVPDYELTQVQKDALKANLSADQEIATAAETLHATMSSFNCYACHRRGQLGGPESDRNSSFVSEIPEMGDEGRIPPPLNGVGDKLKRDWLKEVLTKGARNRPYMKTRMPKFGQGTQHLTDILVQLDRKQSSVDVTFEEADHRVEASGRKLVGSEGLSCVKCHTFGKYKASGIQAIDLQLMAKRINEDWFHRYLPKPEALRPGTRMPTAFPNGVSVAKEIYEGNQSQQVAAIWKYLEAGKKAQVPLGVMGGMIELKPTDRPIIYRNFIEGLTSRAIAVGNPEGAHYAWDADRMSLGLIWHGRFIDAAKHWQGRGQGNQVPLGDHTLKWDQGPAVAVLASAEASWPKDATTGDYRFAGYKLDSAGRPTFRYSIGSDVGVSESIIAEKAQPSASLIRRVQLTSTGGKTGVYFRVAAGKSIVQESGTYIVDQAVRIQLSSATEALIRSANGQQELLVDLTAGPVESKMTW